MSEKMLIDASHPEETRVVVVRGNRIEEFDFESQHKKQLRGNIYLAKVTRVEPSLQAAFVDYGGNRHGFLAFSEIHPDYYQIPLADRQALLAEEAEEARQELEDDEDEKDSGRKAKRARKADAENEEDGGESRPRRARRSRRKKKDEDAVAETAPEANDASPAGDAEPEAAEAASGAETDDAPSAAASEHAADAGTADENTAPDHELSADDADASGSDAGEPEADDNETDEEDGDDKPGIMSAIIETDSISEPVDRRPGGEDEDAPAANGDDSDDDEDEDSDDEDNGDGRKAKVESVGSEDALEEVPDRVRRKPRKQYRIQEVIKRRQILLVQVVKEERGNKGAALTTYLSLAGRYSVLMPNTARGGGISRKITNVTDRKRLKEVARELEVPQGMGVILRTAGANRTKVEIKRDFEYLMRLWDTVRTLTLKSTAPCLVYEEGSLIKRSIRDLYNKNISEVIVSGEEGYREAKDFMKMLMPSHAKVVQPYKELMPIFARSGIDAQLDKMVQPQVTLKSGGYIIINQTEALVAIDVNSGRSTREHSIEDTALQTNLEAAEEVARQLRLRDLAGLIVIDFIDMEENRNNRSVEKKLKECLKNDRARIQVGRISHFGLLEMSRQRIRASVLESTMQVCAHCGGTGHVRSPSSVALHVLRGVEEYLLKHTTHHITVRTTGETALYMLNNKRDTIMEMENRFGLSITFASDPDVGSQYFAVDRGLPVENPVSIEHIHANSPSYDEEEDVDVPEIEDEEETAATAGEEDRERDGEDGGRNKRRRRRRRRGRRGGREENEARFDDDNADQQAAQDAEDEDRSETVAASGEAEDEGEDGQPAGKKRRRGKRGGRKNRDESRASDEGAGESAPLASDDEASSSETEAPAEEAPLATAAADAPSPAVSEEATPDAETTAETEAAPAEKPKRPRRGRKKAAEAETTGAADAETELDVAAAATAPVMAETTEAEAEAATSEAEGPEEGAEADDADGRPKRDRKAQTDLSAIASAPVVTSSSAGDEEEAKEKPKKAGWWQRRGFL